MKTIISISLIMFIMFSSGCASVLMYRHSEQKAIKAVRVENGAGVGVDLSALDVLSQHPFLQIFAAVIDGAILYAGYEALKEGDGQKNEQQMPVVSINGDRNNTSVILGTGNENSTKLNLEE